MLEWIRSIIDSLGYPGITLLSFLETLIPPIPSELVGPLAGFLTTRGQLTFVGVILASMVGFLAGVMPLYLLGKVFGKERLKRMADHYTRFLGLSPEDIENADAWFAKHGGKVVITSHLLPGIRSLISVPAGIAGMNVFKFLLYTAIGKGLWTVLMVYLGAVLGENFEDIGRVLGPLTYVILAALVLVAAVFIWKRRQQSQRQSES